MFNIVRVMQRTTSPHNGVCEVGEGAVCGRDSEDMMAIWSGVYVHMRSGMMSGRVCCGMVKGEEEEMGRRGDESKNEEID